MPAIIFLISLFIITPFCFSAKYYICERPNCCFLSIINYNTSKNNSQISDLQNQLSIKFRYRCTNNSDLKCVYCTKANTLTESLTICRIIDKL